MSLSAGARLGPYEVLAPIGAGGMGEVYRARDTRLKREVALKVLPDAFARDAERMSRFQREAEVLASLNHPNIAAIYGVEEGALAMELVGGETLAGPLPAETALRYARQIAEALEYAHERGVIHRDLKPGNIKVTPDGTVKLLDFGLAKAIEDPGGGAGDPVSSPTLTLAASGVGVIMGTAAYMSPEQAGGKPADRRADIWSFGAVLYEILTGKRAFAGDSISDTLATVLKLDPDWDALPAAAPASIRKLVRRCLTKDRRQRLQAIGEARIAIEEALSGTPPVPEAVPATGSRKRSLAPWAAVVLATAAAAVAFWAPQRTARPTEQPLVRLDVDLGPGVSLGSTFGPDAVLSPDGHRLVYVSQSRLFTRRLDQLKASELTGSDGAYAPFFSPDGQWVGFFTMGKLKKISVEGGAAITLSDAPSGRGGSWGEDHSIIAALSTGGVLSRVPDSGGAPTPVTELAQGEITHRWPQLLPGGKAALFTAQTSTPSFDGADIEVITFADGRRKTLQQGGTFGRYLPTGHLVYISRGTLFAVPFDLDRLDVRGAPVPLLESVGFSVLHGFAQFDFSRSGTLVYRSGGVLGAPVTVQWLDAAGRTQPLLAKPGIYKRPRMSPDGRKLALSIMEGSSNDIWVYEWQRDNLTRLTLGGGSNDYPVWSPDGRYIAFRTAEGMSWTRVDGAGKPQALTQSKKLQLPWSFTPDGKRLAFVEVNAATGLDILTLPLESGSAGLRAGKPEPFLQTPSDERHPSFSPDGRWLAYSSSESGVFQVYVQAFPEKGGRWQVSNGGATYPEWSRNGRELFFITEDNRIMVASYKVEGDSFVPDKPRAWSGKHIGTTPFNPNYDVAQDGKRIVALMLADAPEEQNAQNHVIFLQNFFDDVRRRARAQPR